MTIILEYYFKIKKVYFDISRFLMIMVYTLLTTILNLIPMKAFTIAAKVVVSAAIDYLKKPDQYN